MRVLRVLRVVGLSLETRDLVYVVLTVGITQVVEVIVELHVGLAGLADEVVLVLAGVRTVERSALGQQVLQSAGGQAKPRCVVASTDLPLEDWFLRADLHCESLRAGRWLILVLPLDEAGRGADDEEGRHQGDADDQDQQGEVQGSSTNSSVGFCKGRRFIKNCPENVSSLCLSLSKHESSRSPSD